MKKIGVFLSVIFLSILMNFSAFAVPTLQLYIEGGQYNTDMETWVTESSNFILWVLGDVKSYGTIYDVKIAAAYDSNETGSITFTPTTATAGILPVPGDSSIPSVPQFLTSGVDNAPLMGNGTPLPSHDVYGPGTSWESYLLGNFNLKDSPIGDFTEGGCPDSGEYPSRGQINAYMVNVTGYTTVHFDAFDHIVLGRNKAKYKFAPFSHDGEADIDEPSVEPVPEPGTWFMLCSGLIGLAALRFKRERN